MNPILFAFPGNEQLAHSIEQLLQAEHGDYKLHQFPDGESYVRLMSDVTQREVVVVCTLHQPNEKLLPLYFFCKLLKEAGATSICLVSPYLAYMRQDKQFNPGEAVTSASFAELLSTFVNKLVTVDPHLHRRASMDEIYSIPSVVLHAAGAISAWIKNYVPQAVLIGPDSESEQWVSKVAADAGVPFIVLEKIRRGDTNVEVSVPHVEKYKNHTPVLVDDIISTARTMIETVEHLKRANMKMPVCIGVHAVFAENAYNHLLASGVEQIVTCNTIQHASNQIDLSGLIASAFV